MEGDGPLASTKWCFRTVFRLYGTDSIPKKNTRHIAVPLVHLCIPTNVQNDPPETL